MPTYKIEFREIERREITVEADTITDAIKFVEDGGFYLDAMAEVREQYPQVQRWDDNWGIDVDGRQVITAREEGE